MAESSETLETKRSKLDAKLTALRMSPAAAQLVREADRAVAEYRTQADALETELAEIDRELGVRERDRREAAARQKEERWLAQRNALLREEETRLQAIADAEAACRALVDAINRAFASTAQLAKIAQELSTTGNVPGALSTLELATRLGGRIAGVMSTIKSHRYRLGSIEWQGGSLYPPERSWRDDEEKQMSTQMIQPILEQRGRA